MAASTLDFELPPAREATMPPEARGIPRDHVRLLVAAPTGVTHTRFTRLADHLEPGDLAIVNDSATLAAAVGARRGDGRTLTIHFSGPLDTDDCDDDIWVVELRPGPRADGPVNDAAAGERLTLPAGGRITLLGSYPDGGRTSERLWAAQVDHVDGDLTSYLEAHGQPITYSYVDQPWPLDAYQTVFARSPGSAEMPSAARPFTTRVVTDLVAKGVAVAPITLHTGVSSPEAGEPPIPERYDVPPATSDLVNLTRRRGGRVVAVGTTVTRALETVAAADGVVHSGSGVTDLVLGLDRPARVVTGLVTGWHAPGASHLSLLQAVAGGELVRTAYDAAVAHGYLWHEFGDSCLLLPSRSQTIMT
jgi:S-adenosylmethionine:tRNA ribosyltransferase-isomerase